MGSKIIPINHPMTAEEKANHFVQTALSYKGVPYKFGGATAEGMDCSGLVMLAFQGIGLKISHYAPDQTKVGTETYIDELQAGDLVFFTDVPGHHQITHVGIITRTNYPQKSVTFVHSPSSGYTVREDELLSNYWQSVFLRAIRPNF